MSNLHLKVNIVFASTTYLHNFYSLTILEPVLTCLSLSLELEFIQFVLIAA